MRRILTALLAVIPALTGITGCSASDLQPVEQINFGTVPTAATTLIYIAYDRGFFTSNGLTVNITDYSTGTATTEALLKRELDIAWSAEFPFVRRAFAREEISIMGIVGRFNEQHIFGRRDSGINTITDLKGKKIGIPMNTIAEFYLGRFLDLNGMNVDDVSLVDVQPPEALGAITGGGIDAVIAWEPYASQIKGQLADMAVAWLIQSYQPGYGLVTARNDWISEHPEIVKRFLKSLAQAEDYLARNHATAKTIMQKRLNVDDILIETIWSQNEFSLKLDRSLIIAMEDEARWMITNNLIAQNQVPDFLDYIYEDALKTIKPGAVNIIR